MEAKGSSRIDPKLPFKHFAYRRPPKEALVTGPQILPYTRILMWGLLLMDRHFHFLGRKLAENSLQDRLAGMVRGWCSSILSARKPGRP